MSGSVFTLSCTLFVAKNKKVNKRCKNRVVTHISLFCTNKVWLMCRKRGRFWGGEESFSEVEKILKSALAEAQGFLKVALFGKQDFA